MKIIAIIPARMGSSRFPGKPMAKILGTPMIGHCVHRVRLCDSLLDTYVATCDQEIYDYVTAIGGKAVMTSQAHERASDRTAEAMLEIELQLGFEIDLVVMVQGDEPMVTPDMLETAIGPFRDDSSINVVNLMARIDSVDEFEDPNEVKVVVDKNNHAIYFSREPIPSPKKYTGSVKMLKQVCIIPFKRNYLLKFNEMEETELEQIESVDMLRIIENGESVRMVMTQEKSFSVDTKKDLEKVENEMRSDQLISKYICS